MPRRASCLPFEPRLLRRVRVAAGALILALPAAASGQSGGVALEALLNEADRASPRIIAATAAARAAAQRVPTTTRPPDPQFQLGWMNYGLAGLRPMTPVSMRQVQVMQMLPVAGRLRALHLAAEAGADGAEGDAVVVRAAVRRETATMFFELHRLDRTIVLLRETQQVVRDLRETSAAMYRAGEGRQADVLRAELEVERMATEIARMSAMRVAMASRLMAMLAREPAAPLGVTSAPALPATVPPLDSMQSLARRRRPDLAVADASVARVVALERVARSEIWPDLTIGVQVADGRDLAGMRETMGSLMLGAALPVFARRRQLAMREEAAAMRAMAEADRAMLVAETGGDVGVAYAELLRARGLRASYGTRIIPSAQAALESALAAYRGGTVPFMTALDAQMALNGYREELLLLEAEEGAAWAALEALTGTRWLQPGATPPGGHDD